MHEESTPKATPLLPPVLLIMAKWCTDDMTLVNADKELTLEEVRINCMSWLCTMVAVRCKGEI